MNSKTILKQINVIQNRRASIRQKVDTILNIKQEKDRLREAFRLWLAVNPKIEVSFSDGTTERISAKEAYKLTLEKVAYLKSLSERDDGRRFSALRDDDAGWRSVMEFPPGSMEFLRMFAMNLFNDSGNEQKKAMLSLGKIFPEFVVPRAGV